MSAHEEVDFRLMVHAKHAIDSNSPVIRSHSGDTDTFIMLLTSFYSANLILERCSGAGRKIVSMWDWGRQQKHIDRFSHLHRMAYLMKRSSVSQVEEPPLSDCSWDHEGRSFGLRKHVPVLSGSTCLTAIMLMKVTKRTLTSILEMIVWVMNIIEIRVTVAVLNLLGPFLFVFDILEI